jgi:hypothetical protein
MGRTKPVTTKPESTPSETIGGRLREIKRYRVHVQREGDDPLAPILYVACPPAENGGWLRYADVVSLLREAADEYERLRRRVQEVETDQGLPVIHSAESSTVPPELAPPSSDAAPVTKGQQ